MRIKIILLLINVSIWWGAKAQSFVFSLPDSRFELQEEQIRYLTQLPDGRLIVCTESTINLFNGGGFKTINIDERDVLHISKYPPYQYRGYLAEGRLWIKNQNRIIVINIATEKGQENPLSLLKDFGFPEAPANFFVDIYNDLWVLTESGKLYRYDNKKRKVSVFLNAVTDNGLSDEQILDLVRLDGRIYLFYKSGVMRCFDEAMHNEIYRENFQKQGTAEFESRLWVNVVGSYLYLVRNSIGLAQLVRFDTRTRKTVILLENTQNWLNNLTADNSGNFWISGKAGMWYFRSGNDNGTYYPHLTLVDGHTENNEISTLLYDKQGILWAGTLNKGLYYYHPSRFRFQKIDKSYFLQEDTEDLRIYSIFSTPDKLWLGALDGLYAATWKNGSLDGKFKKIIKDPDVRSLYRSQSGTLWVGTSAGLYSLDNRNHFDHHLDIPIYSISEAEGGKLWICTLDQGLHLYDPELKKDTLIFPPQVLNKIKQVISWNNYWAGVSEKGLFFIDKDNLTLQSTTNSIKADKRNYPSLQDYFICLFSDDEGMLWMGSYGNLYAWDPKTKKLYTFGDNEGLANKNIKAIIQGKDKTLWVTTSRGISNIRKTPSDTGYHFTIRNYSRYDGVMEHTFSEKSIFKNEQSELFFGGVDGLNVLNENLRLPTKNALTPVLTGFKLFGKPVSQGAVYGGRIILENAVESSAQITLNYNQNFFSIVFSGLNYINSLNTHYKYKLDGIDNEWRIEKSTSGIGEATYTRLPPGRYTFKVLTSEGGLEWDGQPKILQIIINPPFWLTIYAKLAYAVLLIIAGWYSFRYFKRREELKRQNQQKKAIENAKAAFITNISHELRTPLTLIITPLKSLISRISDIGVRRDLQQISNNADLLLDNINQLLEFKKIDEAAEELQLKYVTNLSFIKDLFAVYESLSKEKKVLFEAVVQDVDEEMWIDTSKVTRLITNLLSNAFKFTPAGGNITAEVKLNTSADTLIIKIKDSGIGILQEEQSKIFDRFYQSPNQITTQSGSGIGLYMVKQYAEMHGGSVSVANNSGGKGCLFVVNLLITKRNNKSNETSAIDSKKKTILIVEDHKSLRKFITKELESSYNIIEASNGIEGLSMTQQNQPDLIITDMMMPEMNGDEMSKKIRNDISVSHTPIIILTAQTSTHAHFEGYESGADAYLVKPFDMELLRLRIRKLMQMVESRRNAFVTEKEVKVESITTNPLDKELLERALQLVNNNIGNPDYSVEKFSSDMHMDRTGLYRKLIALTGQAPTSFIRTIRLNKAVELIQKGQLSVSDIAIEVGFNSVSYFSKCFHDKFGKTPSQYMQ